MPDVWLDTVTPKISIAIHSLLPVLHAKGYTTLVTAKKQTQTTDMLDALKVPYHKIGDYGETLKEKLAVEAKRTSRVHRPLRQSRHPKSALDTRRRIRHPNSIRAKHTQSFTPTTQSSLTTLPNSQRHSWTGLSRQ